MSGGIACFRANVISGSIRTNIRSRYGRLSCLSVLLQQSVPRGLLIAVCEGGGNRLGFSTAEA